MKSILDPTFAYRPSYDTDLRRTFERARRGLQTSAAAPAAAPSGAGTLRLCSSKPTSSSSAPAAPASTPRWLRRVPAPA